MHVRSLGQALWVLCIATLLSTGCRGAKGSSGSGAPPTTPADTDTDTDTDAHVDTDADTDSDADTDTAFPLPLPVAIEWAREPTPDWQGAVLSIDAPPEASLTVRWSDALGHEQLHHPPAGTTSMPVLGLRPDRTYRLTVEAEQAGALGSAELSLTSQPLPADLPQVDLVVGDDAEPFFVMVPLSPVGDRPEPSDVLVVLDEAGEVVFWQTFAGRLRDARPYDVGYDVLVGNLYPVIAHMSWSGEVLGGWQSPDDPDKADPALATADYSGRFHHDFLRRDDGTAYVLSKATAADVPYPTDYELSGLRTADVSADIVLHLADDGTLLDSLRLDDVLSTLRIGYGGLQRTNLEGEFDWTHANAVVEHPDGDLLLSLRHQDAIVKVDPVTGALDWILGNHDNWPAELQPYLLAPDASVTWPFHTHGVKVRADGVITLFDNGNFRDTPGPDTDPLEDVETWSRVVGFAVDPIARTVTQAFEHEPEQRTFAYAVGDCDPLSNGHTIGHFGRIIVEDGQYNDDLGRSVTTIRIIEWAPDGTEVWHAHLFNDPAVFPEGWYAYRSERFESFYAYQ